MNRDVVTAPHTCDKCQHQLTRIDFYGEQLEGCAFCNVWIDTNGTWRKLPDEDIVALKGLRRTEPAR
jgi:hypothetical protein